MSQCESGRPAHVVRCDLGLDLQEAGTPLEMMFNRCFQEAASDHSTSHRAPSCQPCPLGQPLPLGRRSAELQVLVLGDVVLELVGFKELAQLIDVVLVQLVHLLL